MSSEDDTDPSAPIPLWIEKAVLKGLKVQDETWAAREARMLASEARILAALDGLGIARLELAQKATEATVRNLREEVDSLLAWRRDTERCPPPSEHAGGE